MMLPENIMQELSYRKPMQVVEIRKLSNCFFAVCPRCQMTLECEYQAFCDRCGQRLNWRGFCQIKICKESKKKRTSYF